MSNIKAHLITKSILAQFGDGRYVIQVDKNNSIREKNRPKKFAYVEHDEKLIQEAEDKWQLVEGRLKPAYKKLRKGELLATGNEYYVDIFKKTLALHYVRSKTFYQIRKKISVDLINKALAELNLSLGGLNINQYKYAVNKFKQIFDEGVAKSLIKTYEDIINFIDNADLVVGRAVGINEFIIGDIPVLTITSDHKLGVLQNNITLDKANAVGMPVSKQYIIALSKNNKNKNYFDIDDEGVISANSKQIQQCLEYYYCRPDSMYDK